MEHEILDLIDKYWKFDDDQTPLSNWHDKQKRTVKRQTKCQRFAK